MKSLNVNSGLKERVEYISHNIPVSTCTSNFDDYYKRSWPVHWHDEFEFAIVTRGCVRYTLYPESDHTITLELHPGEGLYIMSGMLHSAEAMNPDTVVEDLIFQSSLFIPELYDREVKPILDSQIPGLKLSPEDPIQRIILEVIHGIAGLERDRIGFETHTLELVYRLWHCLIQLTQSNRDPRSGAAAAVDHRLKDALRFIHTHYDQPIRIEDIASASGCSRTETFRLFRRTLELTPIDYLNNYRLRIAAGLLQDTDRQISEIAMSSGFREPSYFSRLFRKKYQMSPLEYRRRIQ